ncbi:3-isopropylmalate dehydratase small subunit [Frankia sp. AiPs1]|nr:3-isopropylmalate dehydratase small subunit [Frankia sp. AiPs1]
MPLRRSNVDTDQIIPVRFLHNSRRTGHAESLFADWRDEPDFVFNRHDHQGATILVAGHDFGTGSSREYAVWALLDHGFRAVLAPRFGDIFRENALLNGLLAVALPLGVIEELWDMAEAAPATELTVDLVKLRITGAGVVYSFDLDPRMRARILDGTDQVAGTLRYEADIARYEDGRRRALPTTG